MSQAEKQVTIGAVIAKAVESVVLKGEQHGAKHSFEYWLEECIVTGAQAKVRSWDYADDTRNAKAFKSAVGQLNPQDSKFVENYQRLASKYGVGGTRA